MNFLVASNQYVNNSGVILYSSAISLSEFIGVVGGQTYSVSKGYSSQGGVYDVNKNWISAIPHPTNSVSTPVTFTLPPNAAYVRLNVLNVDIASFTMVLGINYIPTYIGYNPSKWSLKKWGVVGDSITELNFRTSKNYHGYIADEIKCLVSNYGVSGTGWRTPNSAGTGRPIYERISAMDSTLDLVTVFAGTNDWGQTGIPLVLGAFGDTNPSASLYGAIDNTLKQLVDKYPTKKIAVFTPLPRGDAFNGPNSAGIYLSQVADAIIQVSDKYSIRSLDLYRGSGLFPWNDAANEYYFKAVGQTSGDRLHPNDAGHADLADIILPFINSL